MAACYKCGQQLDVERPTRSDSCDKCSAWLRCCRNCRFFRPPNDCAEPQAEWVPNRESANFCEFFALTDRAATAGDAEAEDKPDPFDALFKK